MTDSEQKELTEQRLDELLEMSQDGIRGAFPYETIALIDEVRRHRKALALNTIRISDLEKIVREAIVMAESNECSAVELSRTAPWRAVLSSTPEPHAELELPDRLNVRDIDVLKAIRNDVHEFGMPGVNYDLGTDQAAIDEEADELMCKRALALLDRMITQAEPA